MGKEMKTNEITRADSSASVNILDDIQTIVETARANAYTAVNVALVQRNWLIGKRIAEEELEGENRAEYGEQLSSRCRFRLLKFMARALLRVTYISLCSSINSFRTFSTH